MTPRKALYQMPYGKERREAILAMLRDPNQMFRSIPVNRRHCPQLHQDIDLSYMVKKDILKQVRRREFGKIQHTYLVLNDVRC